MITMCIISYKRNKMDLTYYNIKKHHDNNNDQKEIRNSLRNTMDCWPMRWALASHCSMMPGTQ